MLRVLRRFPSVLVLAAFAAALSPASAGAVPRLVPVGTFTAPMYVTAPPGDASRLMVVERAGRVRVVRDGVVQAAPFLDLPAAGVTVSTSGERGLASIAFAPDYATSGLVYAFYTDAGGDIVIAEFRSAGAGSEAVDPATRRTVLTLEHSAADNHNGGQLQFGPDGMLYVSVGDGGGGGDPDENGQDLSTHLGKLLRLDPRANGSNAYTVPASNPYLARGGIASLIWASGLRNPWRFSFDRASGDLLLSDVGQGAREEVNLAPAPGLGRGANYGWRCWEGTSRFDTACDPPDDVAPTFEYDHSGGRCSITGGYVVRDPQLPGLVGRYVYADFCAADLRSVELAPGAASGDATLGLNVPGVNSFGEDACGRVHVVSIRGPVARLEDDTVASSCTIASVPPPPTGDTDPPLVGTPALAIDAGRVVGARSVPVRLRWSASDDSGVDAVQVQVRTLPTTTWRTLALGGDRRQLALTLAPGRRTFVRIRARDASGTWSSWRSAAATAVLLDATRTTFRCSTGWRATRTPSSIAGSLLVARATSSACSTTLRARSVGLVAPRLRGGGTLAVTLGSNRSTLRLAARPTQHRRVVAASARSMLAPMRVAMRLGRGPVAIDAIVALR